MHDHSNPTPASPTAKVVRSVQLNKAAREAAEAIAELCLEQGREHGQRFWQSLDDLISKYLPTPCMIRQQAAMTDEEAAKFGCEPMPFGQWNGEPIHNVPVERLEWYADQRFNEQLRRYLKSPKIAAERNRDE